MRQMTWSRGHIKVKLLIRWEYQGTRGYRIPILDTNSAMSHTSESKEEFKMTGQKSRSVQPSSKFCKQDVIKEVEDWHTWD